MSELGEGAPKEESPEVPQELLQALEAGLSRETGENSARLNQVFNKFADKLDARLTALQGLTLEQNLKLNPNWTEERQKNYEDMLKVVRGWAFWGISGMKGLRELTTVAAKATGGRMPITEQPTVAQTTQSSQPTIK